jgi:colanic acid/amylovoran biosynthesis glycosyltransferase
LRDELAGDWLATWRGGDAMALRDRLAHGQLPRDHCGGCASWASDGLIDLAPFVRDHGSGTEGTADHPTTLVLRLPANGDLDDASLAQFVAALPALATLVVDSTTPWAERGGQRWVQALASVAEHPAIELRGDVIGDPDRAIAALRGLHIRSLQLRIGAPVSAELAAARRVAGAFDAAVSAWFEFTPATWFWFEDAARACSAHAIPLELRILGRDGEVPLAGLDIEDLALVKNAVASAWERCSGAARPRALADYATVHAAGEIRKLLLRRLDEGAASSPRSLARLHMPDVGHPWFTDGERLHWWQDQVFGAAHVASVREHFTAILTRPGAAELLHTHAWLRALCQRLTAYARHEGLLGLLRAVYGPPATRADLIADDERFAARFDLTRFGGPWAHELGLTATAPRQRPFGSSKRRAPTPEITPDVTVLVPSYRHQDLIGDTIRSVLAQRHTNFRLLVVDDHSPDLTVARAREFDDPRIDVRVNAVNLGLGNSVLQALATIDTPYVALLNSDDLFHPDRLAKCCAVLDSQPEVMVVTSGLVLVDTNGGRITADNVSLVHDGVAVHTWVHWFARAQPHEPVPSERLFTELLERNFLATSSNLVVRTAWLRQRSAALESLKYCLDWQLFLDAARERALHHLPEPLVAYRLHATNTVWFREGRRWAFYLEVNRVLTTALRDFASAEPADEDRLLEVLEAASAHLLANREADSTMMFVHSLVDGLDLDRLSARSPRIQERVRELETAAKQLLELRDQHAATRGHDHQVATWRRLLADTAREQARIDGDRSERLHRHGDDLEQRLRELRARSQQLDTQRQELVKAQQGLQSRAAELERKANDATSEAQRARVDLGRAVEQSAAIQELRTMLADDLKALHHEIAGLRTHRESLEDDLRQAHAAHAALSEELATARHTSTAVASERDRETTARQRVEGELQGVKNELQGVKNELQRVKSELQRVETDLGRESTRASALVADVARSEQQRDDALAASREARTELDTTRRSREFRIGNFFWNKLPLSTMSRRGKKWYHRFLDAKDRVSLWFGNKYGKHTAEGVAVVASCWHWPIYSHTFVYQEMIGLTHMGLDVRMFHWAENDTAQLQPAFGYLANHRTQIKPVWENHKKDLEHFETTKPGRLRALLERIAPLVGKSVDELYKDPQVVRACTFARMAELAGARYVHTYFFYDQTFMAMVAAWLLEIPRGISCYADHMLDDYPFKLVGLQIELANVVVATSARIKTELSQKSGGRCDDRIIVKPNGVDGTRFPHAERTTRAPGDLFEVLSVSRIEPKKGLLHLVEAVAALKARGHHVKANVVGAPDPHSKGSVEFAEQLQRRITDLGVQDEVVMHGMKMQEDILPMLQRSRAFVAPYVELSSGDKDGIPTAMLEAMAAGLPIVTTDSGSILEVVKHGNEALVVPQRDSAAFAAALEQLIMQPSLERKLGKAARARFDREFDASVTERVLHQRISELLHPVATPFS